VLLELTKPDATANVCHNIGTLKRLNPDASIHINSQPEKVQFIDPEWSKTVHPTYEGNVMDRLRHIAQKDRPERILRLKTNGLKFDPVMIGKFSDLHSKTAALYTYTDTNSVLFYGTILEMVQPEILPHLESLSTPVLPDGTLNGFALNNHQVYYLDYADMSYYYIDHASEYYPNPSHLNIEVTPRCNLHCRMCYYHSSENGVGITDNSPDSMDLEIYKRIVEEACTLRRKPSIDLYLRGEPFLNDQFMTYLKLAKAKGLEVYTTTNATLLTERLARSLVENGIDQITFSLDGYNQETFERIRKGASYKNVLSNIDRFLEINQKYSSNGHKTSTYVKSVIQPGNVEEIDLLIRKWADKVDFVAVQYQGIGHSANSQAHTIEDMYRPPWRMPCICHMTTYTIASSGKLYTCGVRLMGAKPTSIGDLRKSSILQIWDKESDKRRYSSLGQFHRLPFCHRKCRLPINIVTSNKRMYNTDIFELTMSYNKVYKKSVPSESRSH
jgi:MoaA/NifB/PqqE/SkfB family radical SAM enzyme